MKKFLKIAAVLLACVLLVAVCYVANMFLGNPVSYLLAYVSAEKHLDAHYPNTDYVIERVVYNFKFADYYAYISSPENPDGDFSLRMDYKGNVEHDDYAHRVEGRHNTANRLKAQYQNVIVREGLINHLPYDFIGNLIFEFSDRYEKHEGVLEISDLELNKAYDMAALGKNQGYINAWTEVDEPSKETLAEMLLEIKRVADENGVGFYAIDLSLFRTETSVSEIGVDKFRYEDIYEDGLLERIEKNIEETQAYYEQKNQEKEEELKGDR